MSGENELQEKSEVSFLADEIVRHQVCGYSGKVIFSDKVITVVD